ncbi:MAG: dihydrodipicolinate synthase family protein [Planctomycetota bacterium]|jgi:dihydrodipicolinate synthase/N-acetylneuraminate lyase
MLDSSLLGKLRSGCVIPAHPLALRQDNSIDERRQGALTRYYLAAGAGGLAVGVHTTQFAIHESEIGLYRPVLELAMATTRESTLRGDCDKPIMIAGILGDTEQAVGEATLARDLGYDLGLLSLTALRGKSLDKLIDHCREVAEVIPIMGFYLQQVISRMVLPTEFWRKFMAIPNVHAVKIAPFNRYQTLDVLEAVARSGRSDEIALYTGNDDNIIVDLLTRYEFEVDGKTVPLQIVGGLLGQWACWTKKAVEHLARIRTIRGNIENVPHDLLTLAGQLTLANREIFDARNNFAGCIPGISYVLKRQGLLDEPRSLDPGERLSPGQAGKIDRIIRDYPHLTDDSFVSANLDTWLAS